MVMMISLNSTVTDHNLLLIHLTQNEFHFSFCYFFCLRRNKHLYTFIFSDDGALL